MKYLERMFYVLLFVGLCIYFPEIIGLFIFAGIVIIIFASFSEEEGE